MGSSIGRRSIEQRSIEQFRDAHIHAAAINSWNQTYTQISAGRLESSLVQISNPTCHLFREHINQRVVQQGEAPRGRVCFALPLAVPGTAHMQGREADGQSLFCLHGGQEFIFHMPQGMDLLALTFAREFFEAQLARLPDPALAEKIERLMRQPVIKVPPRTLLACRQRLLVLFDQACHSDASATRELESRLLLELLTLLAHPSCDASQRQSTHSYVVEKLHRATLNNALDAPNIFEACRRLRVSRRTVQNSFRAVTDSTPTHYLRSLRLNGVRRQLMTSCAAHASIGDVAADWGFFHMSHFARAYQELFGELPSQTPRATLN